MMSGQRVCLPVHVVIKICLMYAQRQDAGMLTLSHQSDRDFMQLAIHMIAAPPYLLGAPRHKPVYRQYRVAGSATSTPAMSHTTTTVDMLGAGRGYAITVLCLPVRPCSSCPSTVSPLTH